MVDDAGQQHPVKAAVGEGQALDVALQELDAGVFAAGRARPAWG